MNNIWGLTPKCVFSRDPDGSSRRSADPLIIGEGATPYTPPPILPFSALATRRLYLVRAIRDIAPEYCCLKLSPEMTHTCNI